MFLEIRTKEVNGVNRVVGQVFDGLGRQIDMVYVRQSIDCLEDEKDYVRRALQSNINKIAEYESKVCFEERGWSCERYSF